MVVRFCLALYQFSVFSPKKQGYILMYLIYLFIYL